MPNRLSNETSPYLLQHANNPVDWYPWGPEALERAAAEDKPILLSVGYSACHWCHVMERESFENDDIARQMNESFISVKVDREERPDIDSIYMTAVQAMTGRGGWPMTVFLTPDGKPFYGGTYFPPQDRGGMPGFPRVLEAMADAYRENRDAVDSATDGLLEQMRRVSAFSPRGDRLVAPDDLSRAFTGLASQFDDRHGGLGMEPKFPQPMVYEFLLRYYARTGDLQALRIVELTLDRMALGGIYDQLGGGFHRYSTDAFWLVPHFEKMLYDNALLVKLYLHAYQATGKPLYRRVVEETLAYVTREMTDPSGGFYSAQDADSEGEEGKYFVWRPEHLVRILGRDDAEIVNRYYGVTEVGNFEGRSILHVTESLSDLARELGMSEDELTEVIDRSRARLLEERALRVKPGLDDKVITSWNGLMMGAFAEAAAVLDRPDYAAIAAKNASFLLGALTRDGRLLRSYKDGRAGGQGFLEDYAFVVSGLLSLHEASFEERWLREAIALTRDIVAFFGDTRQEGVFYDTARDHEKLILRPRDISDNATPSGSSVAADVLIRMAVITGDDELRHTAAAAIRSASPLLERAPIGAGQWLSSLDLYLSIPREIVIVGSVSDARTRGLLAEVHRAYSPNRVLLGHPGDTIPPDDLPLLESRGMIGGVPTAYVCEGYVCDLPVTTPSDLAAQLA